MRGRSATKKVGYLGFHVVHQLTKISASPNLLCRCCVLPRVSCCAHVVLPGVAYCVDVVSWLKYLVVLLLSYLEQLAVLLLSSLEQLAVLLLCPTQTILLCFQFADVVLPGVACCASSFSNGHFQFRNWTFAISELDTCSLSNY